MSEIVDDIVMPSTLIVPINPAHAPFTSGALYMSGNALCFYDGTQTLSFSGDNVI